MRAGKSGYRKGRYISVVVTLSSLLVITAVKADQPPDQWRLFDLKPAVNGAATLSKTPPEIHNTARSTIETSEFDIPRLVFNGVTEKTYARSPEISASVIVWIDGYPLDRASLPAGVRTVEWNSEKRVLHVVSAQGRSAFIQPGDSLLVTDAGK